MDRHVAALAIVLSTGAARAQFSGPYAPANWTFNANGGNGQVITTGAPASITLIGNDNGVYNLNTDFTIEAVASGPWSFDWTKIPHDKGNYDAAYYLVNGQQFLLGFNPPPHAGSVNVAISAGDIIGFRAWSLDGAIGGIELRITNFNAPVPAPGSMAVFAAGALALGRRCRPAPAGPAAHPA